jgi:arsenate reductase
LGARPIAVALAVAIGRAAASSAEPEVRPTSERTIVLVCAHGNVKSLIASRWLDRRAAERGVAVRAIARGLTPENPVPPAIVVRLGRDGLDVAGYEARALAPVDVECAARVVFIGTEAPAWIRSQHVAVDSWDGIPPASERYDESRDAMRARIEALLDDLASSSLE